MVKVKKIIRTTFKGQTSSWSEAHAVIAENSKVCRCYFLRLPLLMQLGGNDVPNEVVIFSELTWRLCLTVPEASFSWIHKFSSIPGILASKPLQRSKLGHQLTFNSCFGKRIPVIKRVTKLLAVKNDASEQEETIREKEMKRICVLICLFKKEKKWSPCSILYIRSKPSETFFQIWSFKLCLWQLHRSAYVQLKQ